MLQAPLPRTQQRDRKDESLSRLDELVLRAQRQGLGALSADELLDLPALYRYAATRLSLARTEGDDAAPAQALTRLVSAAHALLYRDLSAPPGNRLARAARFLWADCPRAIRAEWRVLALSLGLFYGLALISYVLVARDLEMAFTFLNPRILEGELKQLQAATPDAPFRGNFTFGLGDSASTAGAIIANNTWVALLFFASGLLPPLYLFLLVLNGLMVGTYLGVASHWAQAGNISSILMCHGTLELQAIALGGAAGLVLARGFYTPGVWSRKYALRRESARAWRLLAGIFPMLLLAGMLEGFVSPHAPLGGRVACMIASATILVVWVAFGGRPNEGPAVARES